MVARAAADRLLADLAPASRARRARRLGRRRRSRLAPARSRRAAAHARNPLAARRALAVIGCSRCSRSRVRPGSGCRCLRFGPTRRLLSRWTCRARWTPPISSRAGSRARSSSCSRCSSGAQAGQTALIVFSTHAFTVTPLTTDTRTIASLVSAVDTDIMPRQGSSVEAGLTKAGALLRQTGLSEGEILLITDSEVASGDRRRSRTTCAAKVLAYTCSRSARSRARRSRRVTAAF